ncbi:TlpA family protein disulfide reductase [Confluentibacter sediminis]|uniref:TlpA family protein disulfide reductase n=1 Tax=Confluentibacter sediminis TaxID=2219045 RepID=UPI000DACE9C7|nr:TlpA disulfide reductase family protein [Confluentibacter sediminis]
MKRLFFIFLLVPSLFFAQHTLKGTFTPAEDFKAVLLYKIEPSKLNYIDNATLKDGRFELKLDSNVKPGMYKLIYALPQEENYIDIIYNGKEDIAFTFNVENNVVYQSSSENKLMASYMHSMAMIQQSLSNFFSQKGQDPKVLASIFKTQKETQTNFEEAAKGTIALNFIKANTFYIPEKEEDVKTYMNNLETHFFDHVDFKNEVLQSSNFLSERMFNYVFKLSHQGLDKVSNFKKNIDVFYKAMSEAPLNIKSSLLLELWERMGKDGFEEVANYIADTYLIDIAKLENNQELVYKLTTFRNISLGHKAPDFSFEVLENGKKIAKKLSQLEGAENYIVVFWSSTCSHCLHEIPILEDFVKTQEKGKLKVIAVGLESEANNWKDTITKFPDFIHVFGEGKWENKIGDDYGVTATPTYFILNKDKEIIARPDDVVALKAYFENN